MTESTEAIAGYEARLVDALARIEAGIGRWPAPAAPAPAPQEQIATPAPAAPAEEGAEQLRAELEEERVANAQLQQRVKRIRRKQEQTVQTLEEKMESLQAELANSERQVAKLRRSGEDMRAALKDLQEAAEASAPDAHLINRAMMAELEALRAERATDAAEISGLISALEPLLAEDA
ncbi:MAG: hypothetical protein AAF092_04115 [Pseudomonadota bacterium]